MTKRKIKILNTVFQNPGTLNYYSNQITERAIREGKTGISYEEMFKYLEEAIREKYERYGLSD